MKQRKRIYYSAAQRAEIWDRWKADPHQARDQIGGEAGAKRDETVLIAQCVDDRMRIEHPSAILRHDMAKSTLVRHR